MDPIRLEHNSESAPEEELSKECFAYLNFLRFIAMECRAKRRTNLFEACALLRGDHEASLESHAEALMRCLNEALGKPAELRAPGSSETTFDEQWLLQMVLASAQADEASAAFLLRSRVHREHCRLVRFLFAQIAAHFVSQYDLEATGN